MYEYRNVLIPPFERTGPLLFVVVISCSYLSGMKKYYGIVLSLVLVLGSFSITNNVFAATSVFTAVSVGAQVGTLNSGTAGSATYNVAVTRTGNTNMDVTLSVPSPLPSGVTASFSVNPVHFGTGSTLTKNSTLTITTTNGSPAGVGSFTILGTAGVMTQTTTGVLTINDVTSPVIGEVTPVVSLTNDSTPDYVFTTNEAGAITYGGSCGSATTTAVLGLNTVTFNTLTDGTYSNCTIKVTDAALNQSSTLAVNTFTVDTTAPTIDAVANMTVEATSAAGAAVTITAPSSHDAVDGDLASVCNQVSGTFPIAVTTVTCDKADAAGNAATPRVFTVTVSDTIAPVISGLSNITAEAASLGGGTIVGFSASATDAVAGSPVVTCTPPSGSTFFIGITVVTCTATDGVNTSTAGFNIIIQDTTAPVLVVPVSVTAEATSNLGAIVPFTATAIDLVYGPVTVNCTKPSGDQFALGTTNVTCSASDSATPPNTATSSFNVLVQDTTAPTIDAASDITVEATSSLGALVTITPPMSHDAVDGDLASSCNQSTGTFSIGMTLVTCTKSDASLHVATPVTFNVIVRDTTAPASNVTAPIALSVHKATITITANVTDIASNIEHVEFWHGPAAGVKIGEVTSAPYTFGWDTITEGVTDGDYDVWVRACDDAAVPNCADSAMVTVTVDNTPPVITIDPYNTAQQNTDLTITASTNEGTLNTTTHTFTANGSFDFVATDAAGNVTTQTVIITNIDKVAPVLTLGGSSNMLLMPGAAYLESGASALDDVDGDISSSVVITNPLNTTFPGTYTITYNVTDAAGNHATPVTRTVVIFTRGGGGSGTISGGGGSTPAPTAVVGQVLGAETFKFTTPLRKGMMNDDVMELQNRLRAEGFFTNPTSTKYFGMMTFNALKAWQKAHGLPATGFFGPMSIAEMNK